MGRKLREEAPPPGLPKAKLFLDDLEEIIRVFRQGETKWLRDAFGEQVPDNYNSRLTISADRWECESVEDLKELGRYDEVLEVVLEIERGPTYHFYEASGGLASYVIGGNSLEEEWALYGKIHEIVNRRKLPWWNIRPRSRIVFQRSFEYTGLSAAIKRHGSQIVIVLLTSLATLAANEAVKWLWHNFHRTK